MRDSVKTSALTAFLFVATVVNISSCGGEKPAAPAAKPALGPLRLADGWKGLEPRLPDQELGFGAEQFMTEASLRYDKQQHASAAPYYAAIVLKHPNHPLAWHAVYFLGVSHDLAGDPDGSAEAFQFMLKDYKDVGEERVCEGMFTLGKIERARGHEVEAQQWFRSIVTEHRTSRWAKWAQERLTDTSA